jgi:hypothetical protein
MRGMGPAPQPGEQTMSSIPVFYQAENVARVEHANFSSDATLAEVLAAIRTKHGTDAAAVLFLEDGDEPAELRTLLRDIAGPKGVKVHAHRCLRIEVSVTFNATKEHVFAPGATVARVKRWATEKAFPMSPEEAGEHVLQLSGTTERPSPGTHLGTLAHHPHCRVRFDLVPNERVNGAADRR